MEGTTFTGPLRSNRMRAPLPDEQKDAIETQAVENMKTLGIPDELIASAPVDSLRNQINGTYRLAYYTQEKIILRQTQAAEERREEQRLAREQIRKKQQQSSICTVI